MMTKVDMLNYDFLESYKRIDQKDTLQHQHVTSSKIHVNKVILPGGDVKEDYDFWGYTLEKDGIKYLLSSQDTEGREVDLKELLPIRPEHLQDIAYKGIAYKLINKPIPKRVRPKKVYNFRELVNILSSTSHSNPEHLRHLVIQNLMQLFNRCNYRVCSPPGTGKDSRVSVLNHLTGECGGITNPTFAKLKYLTNLSLLVINEIGGIPKSDWRLVQQFLLDSADFKPETYNNSRSQQEVLNLSNLSIALYYNDITEYNDAGKFVDYSTDGNVLDRFPKFRIIGHFTEDFDNINSIKDVDSYVKSNIDFYKDVRASIEYYKQNFVNELNNFNKRNIPRKRNSRYNTNIGRLMMGYDLYSNSQREFDEHCDFVKSLEKDYDNMLLFPSYFKILVDTMGIPEDVYKKSCDLKRVIEYLTAKLEDEERDKRLNPKSVGLTRAKLKYVIAILEADYYSTKNAMCTSFKPSLDNNGDNPW